MKKILTFALFLGIFAAQAQTLKQGKNTINIASLPAVDTFFVQTGVSTSGTLALQVVFRSVTGTTNGSFNLYQTLDLTALFGEFSNTELPYTISSANEVVAFEKQFTAYQYMPIIITKNQMTGGYIDIYLKVKESK